MNRREAIKRTALILGVAVSPSGITSALAQIARDPAAKPQYLTASRFATARAVAETILPRTDTPGAIDAGVPQYLDHTYGTYLTAAEKQTLEQGLDALETSAQSAHRMAFAKLSSAQQEAMLKGIATGKNHPERGFLRQIRELTLLAFFTSEVVAKNESIAIWDPVPGMDVPCQDLAVTNGMAYFE
jgi:gluconate 2-dehydrogenase gamma chain